MRLRLSAFTTILALIAALIILFIAGKWLLEFLPDSLPSYRTAKSGFKSPEANTAAPAVEWQKVDGEIIAALLQAKSAAETTATEKLEAWIAVLMQRVDQDFLEWYFDYWNQQKLGAKGAWKWALYQTLGKETDFAENITEEIQEEFAWRVLRPDLAQPDLERLAQEVLDVYLNELAANLAGIPEEYQIPRPEWESYLNDIAVLTAEAEGTRRISFSLKAVSLASAGGGVALATALAPTIKQIGSNTSSCLAAKAAGSVASKTGARVAGKFGGKWLGLLAGVGLIFWEWWDHQQTREIERPKLRQDLADYFAEIKLSLLYDPETGIIAMLDTMEANVLASLGTPQVRKNDKAGHEPIRKPGQ